MKIKVIILAVLLMLSGCTLVDPLLSEYDNEVFVMMGITIGDNPIIESLNTAGFYYPGEEAANHGGDYSQYVFDSEPFAPSNQSPNIWTDYDEMSVTLGYNHFLYLNKAEEGFIKPQSYAIYRNIDSGKHRIVKIGGDEYIHDYQIYFNTDISILQTLIVNKTAYLDRGAIVQVNYRFMQAPTFRSISIFEYDIEGNLIHSIEGIEELDTYTLRGDKVHITAFYETDDGKEKQISKVISSGAIDDQCYVGDNDDCEYKDTFTYFVNGDGMFAKRMRIDFRK